MDAGTKNSPLSQMEMKEKMGASSGALSLGKGWISVITKLLIVLCLGLYVLCSNLPQVDSGNKGLYGQVCLYAALVAGVCILVQGLEYLLVVANNASEGGIVEGDGELEGEVNKAAAAAAQAAARVAGRI